MDAKLHSELIKDIETLKLEVARYSSVALIGSVAVEIRHKFFPGREQSRLMSPVKQCFYLLGIMLTTAEPENPQILQEKEFNKLIELLNKIFQAYALMFWPSQEEQDNLTEEWHRCRKVAMPAFLHYFNTGLLASVEQIKKVHQYIVC